MGKKVTIAYFSPTGNTKKSLVAMADSLGGVAKEIDLTDAKNAAQETFAADDVVIFGIPVYGGRIPTAAKDRFAGLKGENTPCLIVATYGNRDFDDALVELADMVQEQGFIVKGAAALVGRHTFGEIQVDRPDEEDLAADKQFAIGAMNKSENAPAVEIPGNRPYKDGGKGGPYRPLTSDTCVQCGLCARLCPMQAIGEDNKTIADTCISCFRCIRRCPVGAKNMDTEAYHEFAVAFTERLKERKENKYFL